MASNFGFLEKVERRQKQTLVPYVQVLTKNFPLRQVVVLCSNNTDRMRNSRCLSLYRKYTKNKLQDVSIQQWNTSVKNNSLCRLYASYKYKYRIEPYVFTLRTKDRIELSRFRCAALIITDVREKFTGVKETH